MIEINTHTQDTHVLSNGDTTFTFLPTGDLFQANVDGIMLNQVLGNGIDGSMNNIFLRVHKQEGIIHVPLLGIQSNSLFAVGEHSAQWAGRVDNISYTVTFQLGTDNIWFWTVDLAGDNEIVDVVYGWDLGLSPQASLQTNEGYVSHYVGHTVFNADNGFIVCSRQNQLENLFPYIQQGGLTKIDGYSTDGFQFFGKSYKETNQIEQLSQENLANQVYQYEFNYIALKTSKVKLEGKEQFVFYGLYKANHPEAITTLEYQDRIEAQWQSIQPEKNLQYLPKLSRVNSIGAPLNVINIDENEITEYYPSRIQEERKGNKLLSFFTDDYRHITLKAKELELERQQGHIIYTKNERTVDQPIMATTSWMVGVFNSQVVLGNTTMNKFMTNTRNHLNILKTQGQRIYVKTDDQYHLLTMPSLFEMGFNYAKWVYKTTEDTFIVTNFTDSDSNSIQLTVKSVSEKEYAYKITNQIVLNDQEYRVPFQYQQDGNLIKFKPSEQSVIMEKYPALRYYMKIKNTQFNISDGSSLTTGTDENHASLFVIDTKKTAAFSIIIQGTITNANYESVDLKCKEEELAFREFYGSLMNYMKLSHSNLRMKAETEKMNIILWWYTHNMFIHYLSPHGLEQYGGAAWGTRDVAQGPAEYFLAMGEYDIVKDIIYKLYSHQFIEDGNWPQWFMFDNYRNIYAEESHGDIVVWPMKLLGDYLETTGDYKIFDQKIPYFSRKNKNMTQQTDTLLNHLKKELNYITDHFLGETYLSAYGDGDWDDTLQPHDKKLKKYMISSWTVALTYEAVKKLAKVTQPKLKELARDLSRLAQNIEKDYHRIIMSDKVIPGFVYMENDQIDFMIHPRDTTTGINYRLLPMIRSIISELFNKSQVEKHFDIIQRELSFVDGIRL